MLPVEIRLYTTSRGNYFTNTPVPLEWTSPTVAKGKIQRGMRMHLTNQSEKEMQVLITAKEFTKLLRTPKVVAITCSDRHFDTSTKRFRLVPFSPVKCKVEWAYGLDITLSFYERQKSGIDSEATKVWAKRLIEAETELPPGVDPRLVLIRIDHKVLETLKGKYSLMGTYTLHLANRAD